MIVVRLPEATREAQLEAHGLRDGHVGSRPHPGREECAGHDSNSPVRRVRRPERNSPADIGDDGWSGVYPGGAYDGGMVAHRGVIHPSEYVDTDVLREAVCGRLGFTATEIASVYRQGPLGPASRDLRDSIDDRLLELSEAGGLMVELARALGWRTKPGGRCDTLDNALRRARDRRAVAA